MAISLYSWIRDVGTASCVSGHTFTLFIYMILYHYIHMSSARQMTRISNIFDQTTGKFHRRVGIDIHVITPLDNLRKTS